MKYRVEPSKKAKEMVLVSVVILLIVIILPIFVLPLGNALWLPWIIFDLFLIYLIVKFVLCFLRSFEFDEKGCRISIGFISRFYSWEYYKIKSIEDCTKTIGNRVYGYKKAIVFSKKHRSRLTLFLDPSAYFLWFGSFSFIFLFYQPNDGERLSINEINDEDFIAFLQDIGVNIGV